MAVEERAEAGAARVRRGELALERALVDDGTRERQGPVEHEVEADAHGDRDLLRIAAQVGRGDGQRGRRAARARDAAEGRAGGTVVAGGRDHERVELQRALDRPRLGRVGEGGVRNGLADQRDPRRVVGVAVEVRVDGALEAGDHLVGARVHGRPAGDRRLPARDADRQHRGAGRDPAHPARTTRADEDPGHLGAVPLDPVRAVRIGRCARVGVVADEVDPGQDAAAQVRVGAVDAGVEQSDRHAASVIAGQPQRRQAAGPARDALGTEQVRGHGRGVGRPHRVDAGHFGPALEHRHRARVERRGEAVQNA